MRTDLPKMGKQVLLLWVLACSTLTTIGQTLREVPREKEAFYKVMYDAFETADKDFAKDVFEAEFLPFWNAVSDDDANFVYDVAELMVKKRFSVWPYYRQFLMAFYKLKSDPAAASGYAGFQSGMREVADGRSKSSIEEYLSASYNLLTYGMFYTSKSVTWSISQGTIEFRNDSLPAMVFNNANLRGSTGKDSTIITQADAVYFPTRERLKVSKGRIDWAKAGLDPQQNYADVWDFEVKVKSTFFNVDSARMHSQYIPESLYGILREKITSSGTGSDYPVFESRTRSLLIENIAEGVDYQGGFSLRGKSFSGFGDNNTPSRMIFKNEGKSFLEAEALQFEISQDRIQSPLAKITIRLGTDSIYHSGLSLKYDKENGKLEVLRSNDGISESPFYSSYHQMDFFVQKITWNKGKGYLEFGSIPGEAINKASFESANFFVPIRFKALQSPGERSPLYFLKDMAEQYRSNTFSLGDFANFRRISVNDAKLMIIGLANKGFLYYDTYAEKITLKDKMFDFILANAKKIDYDNIYFESSVSTAKDANARLNLENYDLDIYGVKRISLSDSQAVAMYTDGRTEKITVKKNRDMMFNGIVKAGNIDLYGDSLLFDYDDFTIELGQVDSAALNVIRPDENGKPRFVPVRTKIEDMVGKLYIDNPLNKSGNNADNRKYPILETTDFSYTYYDKKSTAKGVYDRASFYFQIDPFKLDSLDNMDDKHMRFPGVLKSAGIFPDIQDSLKVMETDFSLGIDHQTPPDGLPMYDGQAQFSNAITLTEKGGLQGDGDIKYVTSQSWSKRFNFHPDSTYGVAQKMENRLQTASPDVPDAHVTDFIFKLYKAEDYLLARSVRSPFVMFEDQAELRGRLQLNPAGLTGKGNLDMFNGSLQSDLYRFNNSNAFADTASFTLKAVGGELAMKTENVKAHMDFGYKIGTFTANNVEESSVSFPKSQYVAFMDSYKWYVEKEKIEMSSTRQPAADSTSLASHLLSVHPDQDSLKFVAPKATYDIKEYTIRAEEVEKILVADAVIQPDGGKVNIFPGAVIQTLQNATIIADYVNRFHTIFEASIDIISRKKYIGRGKYDYQDEFGEKQKIAFEDIGVNEEGHTFALGTIPEEQGFKLNSYFDYRGQVKLKALEKGLSFKGSTRIKSNCASIDLNWLAFEGQVDPKDARIPVGENMVNDLGEPLSAGLMLNDKTNQIYPAFITAKQNGSDKPLSRASGFLWFDGNANAYKIGSKERAGGEAVGNVIILDNQSCDLSSEGEFSFGLDLGQVDVRGYGETRYNTQTEAVTLRGSVFTDFFFDDKMLAMVGEKFSQYPFLQPVNIVNTPFQEALSQWLPEKEAKQALKSLSNKGLLEKVPDGLQKPFVFADVTFRWDTASTSFVSEGPLAVATVMENQAFVQVRGKMEVMKSRRGNQFNMYLELDPSQWYFYKYRLDSDPKMQTYSSNADYLARFDELKEGDLVMKTKKDEAAYRFEKSARTSKDAFLDRVNR